MSSACSFSPPTSFDEFWEPLRSLSLKEFQLRDWNTAVVCEGTVLSLGRNLLNADELLNYVVLTIQFEDSQRFLLIHTSQFNRLATGVIEWKWDQLAQLELVMLTNATRIPFPLPPALTLPLPAVDPLAMEEVVVGTYNPAPFYDGLYFDSPIDEDKDNFEEEEDESQFYDRDKDDVWAEDDAWDADDEDGNDQYDDEDVDDHNEDVDNHDKEHEDVQNNLMLDNMAEEEEYNFAF